MWPTGNLAAQVLISIHDDVGRVEQPGFGQVRDRAPSAVSRKDGIAKRCLMEPRFDLA